MEKWNEGRTDACDSASRKEQEVCVVSGVVIASSRNGAVRFKCIITEERNQSKVSMMH